MSEADGEAIPPFVTVDACVGLHGSASTWVFNVVRELRLAAGPDVASGYADDLAHVPRQLARRLVLKSHHGDAALDAWLAAKPARFYLSLRDPRDAAISMSQRFDAPLAQTARWIAPDCRRFERLAVGAALLLRYEDGFFERVETVRDIAAKLGVDVSAETIADIFARYSAAGVRAHAAILSTLPPERTQKAGAHLMDKLTQIHGVHLGDGSVGKWLKLPAPAQTELTQFFAPFLKAFGYAV